MTIEMWVLAGSIIAAMVLWVVMWGRLLRRGPPPPPLPPLDPYADRLPPDVEARRLPSAPAKRKPKSSTGRSPPRKPRSPSRSGGSSG